jgi:hypothetical protein
VRRAASVTGQLAFDDCTPEWPTPGPPPRRRPAGTRYQPHCHHPDQWGVPVTREHTPRPGVTWNTELVRTETVVDDDAPDPEPPSRKTRRAQKRAARRKNR